MGGLKDADKISFTDLRGKDCSMTLTSWLRSMWTCRKKHLDTKWLMEPTRLTDGAILNDRVYRYIIYHHCMVPSVDFINWYHEKWCREQKHQKHPHQRGLNEAHLCKCYWFTGVPELKWSKSRCASRHPYVKGLWEIITTNRPRHPVPIFHFSVLRVHFGWSVYHLGNLPLNSPDVLGHFRDDTRWKSNRHRCVPSFLAHL